METQCIHLYYQHYLHSLSLAGDAEKTEATTKAASVEVNGETVATVNGTPIGSEDFAMLAARKSPGKGSDLSLEESVKKS